ncbi:hypothetical protein GCM10009747_34680 [Agromyces humatus]|uniref:Resolvase/invertase-type recombinase catalytic domain-containing protein n=2 Tax=Agromyces humatus TaxID=279573 RepID=A0ABN2KZP8_9MICO
MLDFAQGLRDRDAGHRVLNLAIGDVDTSTPTGSMLFTIMAALAQLEHDIKRERIVDSISKRRDAGKDHGGRPAVSPTAKLHTRHPPDDRPLQAGNPSAGNRLRIPRAHPIYG